MTAENQSRSHSAGHRKGKRFERPAFRDGWALGTLWAAENALVRLVGDASRRQPEADHISKAFGHVRAAIEILNERSERRRDG